MFKHLLVPLDGSRLAEAALPAAAYLAARLSASLTLVHIIERDVAPDIHGERHLTSPEEAHAYLEEAARRAFAPEERVEIHVQAAETGDLARGIVDHIAELKPDLIVMCTHGRGGLRDVLYGSIAQQVVGGGAIPVLLIQPKDEGPQPAFSCQRVVVPLDGQSEHEAGLTAAVELAGACGAELTLVLVVPTLSTLSGARAAAGLLLPGTTAHLLDIGCQEAEAYLRERLSRLQERGISASAEIGRGDPVGVIVKIAARVEADLVVLGTHGKAGTDAFWSGSIAPRVSVRAQLPLLLAPVAPAGRT